MAFTKVRNATYRVVSDDKALNISGALLLPAKVTDTEIKSLSEGYTTSTGVDVNSVIKQASIDAQDIWKEVEQNTYGGSGQEKLRLPIETRTIRFTEDQAAKPTVAVVVDAGSDTSYSANNFGTNLFVASLLQSLADQFTPSVTIDPQTESTLKPFQLLGYYEIPKPRFFDQFNKEHDLEQVLTLLEGFGGNILSNQQFQSLKNQPDRLYDELADLISTALIDEIEPTTKTLQIYLTNDSLATDIMFRQKLKEKIEKNYKQIEKIKITVGGSITRLAQDMLANTSRLVWISTASARNLSGSERNQQIETQQELRRKVRKGLLGWGNFGQPSQSTTSQFAKVNVNSAAGSGKTTTAVHHTARAIMSFTDYFYSLLVLNKTLLDATNAINQRNDPVKHQYRQLLGQLLQQISEAAKLTPVRDSNDQANIDHAKTLLNSINDTIQALKSLATTNQIQELQRFVKVWETWYSNVANQQSEQIALFDILQMMGFIYEEQVEPNSGGKDSIIQMLELLEAVDSDLFRRYINPTFLNIIESGLEVVKLQIDQFIDPQAQVSIRRATLLQRLGKVILRPVTGEIGSLVFEFFGGVGEEFDRDFTDNRELVQQLSSEKPRQLLVLNPIGTKRSVILFEREGYGNSASYREIGARAIFQIPSSQSFARATSAIQTQQLAIAQQTIDSTIPPPAPSTGQEIRNTAVELQNQRPLIVGATSVQPTYEYPQTYERYNQERQTQVGKYLWEMTVQSKQVTEKPQEQTQRRQPTQEEIEAERARRQAEIARKQELINLSSYDSVYQAVRNYIPKDYSDPLRNYVESDTTPPGIELKSPEEREEIKRDIKTSINKIVSLYLTAMERRIARRRSLDNINSINNTVLSTVERIAKLNTHYELETTRLIQNEVGKILYYILTLDETELIKLSEELGLLDTAQRLGGPNSTQRKQVAYSLLTSFIKSVEDIVYIKEFSAPTALFPSALNGNVFRTILNSISQIQTDAEQGHLTIQEVIYETNKLRSLILNAFKRVENSGNLLNSEKPRVRSYLATLSAHFRNPYFASQLVANVLNYTSSFVAMTEHFAKEGDENPYNTFIMPEIAIDTYQAKRKSISSNIALTLPEPIQNIIYESFTQAGSTLIDAHRRYISIYGTLNAIMYALQNPVMGGLGVATNDYGQFIFTGAIKTYPVRNRNNQLVKFADTSFQRDPESPNLAVRNNLFRIDYLEGVLSYIQDQEAEHKTFHPISKTMPEVTMHYFSANAEMMQNLARFFSRQEDPSTKKAIVQMYKHYSQIFSSEIAQDITWRIGPYPAGLMEYWNDNEGWYVLVSTRFPQPSALPSGIPHPYEIANYSYYDATLDSSYKSQEVYDAQKLLDELSRQMHSAFSFIPQTIPEIARLDSVPLSSWAKASPGQNDRYRYPVYIVVPYEHQQITPLEIAQTFGLSDSKKISLSDKIVRISSPYIIVDEAQDSSAMHWNYYELLSLGLKLFNPDAQLFVVGDDMQQIYYSMQNYKVRELPPYMQEINLTLPTVRNPDANFGPTQAREPQFTISYGKDAYPHLSIKRVGTTRAVTDLQELETDLKTSKNYVSGVAEQKANALANRIGARDENPAGRAIEIGVIPNAYGISHAVYGWRRYRNNNIQSGPDIIDQILNLIKQDTDHKHIIIEIVSDVNQQQTQQQQTQFQISSTGGLRNQTTIGKIKEVINKFSGLNFALNEDTREAKGAFIQGKLRLATPPIPPTTTSFATSAPAIVAQTENGDPLAVKIQMELPALSEDPIELYHKLIDQLEQAFAGLGITRTALRDIFFNQPALLGIHIVDSRTQEDRNADGSREIEFLLDELTKAISFTANKHFTHPNQPANSFVYTTIYSSSLEGPMHKIFESINEVFKRRFEGDENNPYYLAELAMGMDLVLKTLFSKPFVDYANARIGIQEGFPSFAILTSSNLEEHLASALLGQWYASNVPGEDIVIPSVPPAIWNVDRSKGREADVVGVLKLTKRMGLSTINYVALTRHKVGYVSAEPNRETEITTIRYSAAGDPGDLSGLYQKVRNEHLKGKNAPSAQLSLANWRPWSTTWFAQSGVDKLLESVTALVNELELQRMNSGIPYPNTPSVTALIELAYGAIGMQIGVDRKAQSRPVHDKDAPKPETTKEKYDKPDVLATILEAVSDIPTISATTEREGYEGLTSLLLEMDNPKVANMVVNSQFIPIIRSETSEDSKGGIKWKARIRANNMPDYDFIHDKGVTEIEIYEMAPLNGGTPHNPENWKRFLSPYIISNIGLSVDIRKNTAELPPLDGNNQQNLTLNLIITQEPQEIKDFIGQVVIDQARHIQQKLAESRENISQMGNGAFANFVREKLYEVYDSIPSDTNIWRKMIVGLLIDGVWFNDDFTQIFRQITAGNLQNLENITNAIFDVIYPRSIRSHQDISHDSLQEMMDANLSPPDTDEEETDEILANKADQEYSSSAGDAAEEGTKIEYDRLETPFIASASVGENAFRRIVQGSNFFTAEQLIIENLYRDAIDDPKENIYTRLANYNLAEPGALIESKIAVFKNVVRSFLESPSSNYQHPLIHAKIKNREITKVAYIPAATIPIHQLATPLKYRTAILQRLRQSEENLKQDLYQEEIEAIKGYWGFGIDLLSRTAPKDYLVRKLGDYAVISSEDTQERMDVLPDPIALLVLLATTTTIKRTDAQTTQKASEEAEKDPTPQEIAEAIARANSVTVTENLAEDTEAYGEEPLVDDTAEPEADIELLVPSTEAEVADFLNAMIAFANAWNSIRREHLLKPSGVQYKTSILIALDAAVNATQEIRMKELFEKIREDIKSAIIDFEFKNLSKGSHINKKGNRARIMNTLLLYSLISDFTRLVPVPSLYVRPPVIVKYTKMPCFAVGGITFGNVPPNYGFVAAMQGDYDGDKSTVILHERSFVQTDLETKQNYRTAIQVVADTVERTYTENLFQGGSKHNVAPPTDAAAKYNMIYPILASLVPIKRNFSTGTNPIKVEISTQDISADTWKISNKDESLPIVQRQYSMPQFAVSDTQGIAPVVKTYTPRPDMEPMFSYFPHEITLLATDPQTTDTLKRILEIPEEYELPMDYHRSWYSEPNSNVLNPIEYYGQMVEVKIHKSNGETEIKYTTLAHLVYLTQLAASLPDMPDINDTGTHLEAIVEAAKTVNWLVDSEDTAPAPINRDNLIMLDEKIEEKIGKEGLTRIRRAYHQTIALHNNSPRSYDPEDFVKKAKSPSASQIRPKIGTPLAITKATQETVQKLEDAERKIGETAVDAALISALGMLHSLRHHAQDLKDKGVAIESFADFFIDPSSAAEPFSDTNYSNLFSLVYELPQEETETTSDSGQIEEDNTGQTGEDNSDQVEDIDLADSEEAAAPDTQANQQQRTLRIPFLGEVKIGEESHKISIVITNDPNTSYVLHEITINGQTIESRTYSSLTEAFPKLYHPEIAAYYLRYAKPNLDIGRISETPGQIQTNTKFLTGDALEAAIQETLRYFEIKPFGMVNTIAYMHAISIHEWLVDELKLELATLITPATVVKAHMSLTRSDAANMKRWINIMKKLLILEGATPTFTWYSDTGVSRKTRYAIGSFVSDEQAAILKRLREVRTKVAGSDVEPIVTTDDGKDLPALQNGKKSKKENFNYILESLQSLVGTVSNAIRRYNETPFVVSEVLDCTVGTEANQERYIAHSAPLAFFVNTPIDKVLEGSQQVPKSLKAAVLKEIRHQIEVLRRYNIMHYNTSETGKFVIGEVRFVLEYKTTQDEQRSKVIAIPITVRQEIIQPLGFLSQAEQKQLENAILYTIINFDEEDFTSLFTQEELESIDQSSIRKNIHSIGLYIRTTSQCLVHKKDYNKVCKKCAGSDEEGRPYIAGALLTGNASMSQGMIDGAKAVITAPNPIDAALLNEGKELPEESYPMQEIQQKAVKSLLLGYTTQAFKQETLRAKDIMLEFENIGETVKKIASQGTGSSQIPMYRYYASGDILGQLQGDQFFAGNNQQADAEEGENDLQAKIGEKLNGKSTLYITITKQDAADERRILGILDEIELQLSSIASAVSNERTSKFDELTPEEKAEGEKATIQDIVFVVSETSTKEQIKSILQKYKDSPNDNEQAKFRRVVGIISTEEFSKQTKRQYTLLSRKLLGIKEQDLRDALIISDDMIAIMIGDTLVTSRTTKDSEKGKQIIKLAKKINKPSVVFDEILYKVPEPQNWERRWGFSYRSLPFLNKQTRDFISRKIRDASDNAELARSIQRDLSVTTLMILVDYKRQVSNETLYEEYILEQQSGIEQETWKALAATVYGARKEGGDILTMLMGLGIYDPLRHDVERISEEQLRTYLNDPALVIGTLPNTRMPGNKPTLRPVARK